MRRRWFYWKRAIRANRPLIYMLLGFLAVLAFFAGHGAAFRQAAGELFRGCGVELAQAVMKDWFPSLEEERQGGVRWAGERPVLFSYLEELAQTPESSRDPAYERAEGRGRKERDSQPQTASGDGEAGGAVKTADGENAQSATGDSAQTSVGTLDGDSAQSAKLAGEVIAMKPPGQEIIQEKLADYDYMMQNFYSVHPTTTAGRDLMNAEKFLSMDLSLEKDGENPQILIYHTHSQEEFADYPENPQARITGVGAYLAELLEQKGYCVLHDTSVYDFRDGKLDRSKAYTYALEGISGILQKYPSIEVVLDIHRDGVGEGTRLVKEINGKPTAQIMFFNGTSQTPDGPIEYLPNPNREANLAFSFQMQLRAAKEYPGFTRKIYLKGLRYNQHVRARTALIEVGAQTNTYEEAKNAMEPLAEILDDILSGREA